MINETIGTYPWMIYLGIMAELQRETRLDEHNIFVENLPEEFEEKELYKLFGDYGRVNFVKAYVDFSSNRRTCTGKCFDWCFIERHNGRFFIIRCVPFRSNLLRGGSGCKTSLKVPKWSFDGPQKNDYKSWWKLQWVNSYSHVSIDKN